MKKYLLVIILAIYTVPTLLAQGSECKESNVKSFSHNEELHYSIHYNSAMIRAAVADATLSVTKIVVNDSTQYQFKGYGKTRSFFNWFYKLDDTYISTVDAKTMKPHRVTNFMREGDYMYDQVFNFDWENNTVNTFGHNIKRDAKYYRKMDLKSNSFDGLSLFYNLRSMDLANIKKGHKIALDLVLEDTVRTINLKFKERENLYLKKLGNFKTLKFTCKFVTSTEEAFADGDEFSLWVTDDANKIPVYVESPIKVGSLIVEIKEWKGLTYPIAFVEEED